MDRIVERHIIRTALTVALTGACLVVSEGVAQADPPEGCIGFPDIPEAFVCIESWTPENVVPSVGATPTTITVPPFCVFQCFGPTEVTVPVPEVTLNEGEVLRVRYRDQVYTVAVPPSVPPLPSVWPGPVGEICRLATSNDDLGVINQDPNGQSGMLTAGPWLGSESTVWVEITCSVQVNNSAPSWDPSYTCRFTSTGSMAGGACSITYTASAADNVFVCGLLRYQDVAGYHEVYLDESGQCALAEAWNIGFGNQFLYPGPWG